MFLTFSFDRAIGFYVLQVYIPLTIIVMSSWVSFWLIKTEMGQETPARTGLGSTTVLAVVTIGFGFVGGSKPSTSGDQVTNKTQSTEDPFSRLDHSSGPLRYVVLLYGLCCLCGVCLHQLYWNLHQENEDE